jgi:hypothetical protein
MIFYVFLSDIARGAFSLIAAGSEPSAVAGGSLTRGKRDTRNESHPSRVRSPDIFVKLQIEPHRQPASGNIFCDILQIIDAVDR